MGADAVRGSDRLRRDHGSTSSCRSGRWPRSRSSRRTWAGIDQVSLEERLSRARRLRAHFEGRDSHPFRVWIWRVGDCVFVGVPGEPYSKLQLELRERHPQHAIYVLGVTNADLSAYLPVDAAYDHDIYQAWQTPYARGCLERVLDAVDGTLTRMLAEAAA